MPKRERKEKSASDILGKKISRRDALSTAGKIAITAVVAGVAAGVAGYLARAPAVKTVVKTVTKPPTTVVTPTTVTTVAPTTPAAPVKIDVMGGAWMKPIYWDWVVKEGNKLLKEKFPEQSPSVNFIPIPTGDELRKKLLLTAAAGKAPDIGHIDCIWVGEFAEGGYLMDITDMVEKEIDVDDFYPRIWKGFAIHKDRVWALPLDTDVRLFYWWKEDFEKAGIDKPPETWDELVDCAFQLVDKGVCKPPETYPLAICLGGAYAEGVANEWYIRLWQKGGELLKDRKPVFNDKAGYEALKFTYDLCREEVSVGGKRYPLIPVDFLMATPEVDKDFIHHKFSMIFMAGGWLIRIAKGEVGWDIKKFEEKLGAAPHPRPKDGHFATMSGGWTGGIMAQTKHPDIAWELLKLMASTDGCGVYAKRGYIAVRKSSYEKYGDFYRTQLPYYDLQQKQLEWTHLRPSIPEYTRMREVFVKMIQSVALGEVDPKSALDDAYEKVSLILGAK